MTDLHRALVRSTGECRYPVNDGTDHCRECGWRLAYVPERGRGLLFVSGYWRHDRRAGRLPPDIPHQSRIELPLSEADPSAGNDHVHAGNDHVHDRTPAPLAAYPQSADITSFARRGGAGGRLIVPSLDEWARWTA